MEKYLIVDLKSTYKSIWLFERVLITWANEEEHKYAVGWTWWFPREISVTMPNDNLDSSVIQLEMEDEPRNEG